MHRRAAPEKPPEWLDGRRLVQLHGPVFGRIALWVNRVRVRRELARFAREAPDERFRDIGASRERIADEAARWFWEEMDSR